MNTTYDVIFHLDALPGVLAVGDIRRGESRPVSAAAALHLVDVKGLAFASAEDAVAARREAAGDDAPPPAAAAADSHTTEI